MQEESQVTLNTVDNVDAFLSDIRSGRWDQVLPKLANLKLPKSKIEDLYEHIVYELVEQKESDTAKVMLRQTHVLSTMQQEDPDRYIALERLCSRTFIDPKELYKHSTRDKRRAALAAAVGTELASVPPSRLMVLIGQALKWQQEQGLLPPQDAGYDLFRGTAAVELQEDDLPVTTLDRTIRFGAKSHPECAAFSPDGTYLVSGSVDGFIEIWDPRTGKISKALSYQREEKFMMHDTAVLCVVFSQDGELLASGSQDGCIKVWRVASGQCLRTFDAAHALGITSLSFSRDGSHVLSSSYDGLVRMHGIKSGKMLKEFRGHSSYVNCAVLVGGGTGSAASAVVVVSASSDATVRVWDVQSCECLEIIKYALERLELSFLVPHTLSLTHTNACRPPQPTPSSEVAVLSIIPNPQNEDEILVCSKSPDAFVMTLTGKVVKTFSSKTTTAALSGENMSDFLAMACSPRGEYVYLLNEDGQLMCFVVAKPERVLHKMEVAEKGPIGVVHHPRASMLATLSVDRVMKTWKAS